MAMLIRRYLRLVDERLGLSEGPFAVLHASSFPTESRKASLCPRVGGHFGGIVVLAGHRDDSHSHKIIPNFMPFCKMSEYKVQQVTATLSVLLYSS